MMGKRFTEEQKAMWEDKEKMMYFDMARKRGMAFDLLLNEAVNKAHLSDLLAELSEFRRKKEDKKFQQMFEEHAKGLLGKPVKLDFALDELMKKV